MKNAPGSAGRDSARDETNCSNAMNRTTPGPRPLAGTDTEVEMGRQSIPSTRGLRVLLVDHSRAALPLARQLEHQGHLVNLLPDGRTTLAIADRTAWDLVWLDAQLDDVPATWSAQWIRQRRPCSYVVLANRHCLGLDETDWRPAWVDSVLPRPWLGRELEAVLRAAEVRRDTDRHTA